MKSPFYYKIINAIRRRVARVVLPNPRSTQGEYSMLYAVEDGCSTPGDFLIDLALDSAKEAQLIQLPELSARVQPQQPDYTRIWPGEHYRLLAALVKVLQPEVVVEIGTFQGLSALALKKFLPRGGSVTTFDIVPWTDIPTTCLVPEDFNDGRLRQELGDLGNLSVFGRHRRLIEQADLLFVDGPKDGVFERKLLENLETIRFSKRLLVIFDDIRLWNMLAIWHEIARPKLDITSFGHWSGTGLIEWQPDPAADGSTRCRR